MDSSVHWILQARRLEWVATSTVHKVSDVSSPIFSLFWEICLIEYCLAWNYSLLDHLGGIVFLETVAFYLVPHLRDRVVFVCFIGQSSQTATIYKMRHQTFLCTVLVATHSRILAWRILWMEKPVGLQSMVPETVRHDCTTNTHDDLMRLIKIHCLSCKVLLLSFYRYLEDGLKSEQKMASECVQKFCWRKGIKWMIWGEGEMH